MPTKRMPDSDHIGDACDYSGADSDGDGITDSVDNCDRVGFDGT
jgi:hypothetical protein